MQILSVPVDHVVYEKHHALVGRLLHLHCLAQRIQLGTTPLGVFFSAIDMHVDED